MDKAFCAVYNTFCTENHTIFCFIFQDRKDGCDFFCCVTAAGFCAIACEHFISVMMVVIVTTGAFFTVVVVMIVAAGTFFTMVVVVVVTAGTFFTVVVVVIVTAGAFFAMIVVVIVAAGAFFVVVVVVMVVAAGTFFTMVVVVMYFAGQLFQFCRKCVFLFQHFQNLWACQLIPVSCKDISISVVLTDKFYCI